MPQTPLLDASSGATNKGTDNPAVSPQFSPPANSVIYAICEADELNTFTVTDSLSTHLNWASVGVSVNQSGAGSIMVFRANCPQAQTNMTVSSTRTGSFTAHGLMILVFTQTETVFTGAKVTGLTATVNLVTTDGNSWVWAAHIEEGGGADTAATGCSFYIAETSFGGIGGGVLQRTAITAAKGTSVTIGVNTPTTPSILAFEVKGAPDPVPLQVIPPGLTPFGQPVPWLGTAGTGGPVSIQASISDTAAAADTVARVIAIARALSDTAPATDTVTRLVVESRSVSDTAPASDTVTRTVSLPRAVADIAAASDTVIRLAVEARGISDTAAASDAVTRVASEPRAVADTAAASDAVTRALTQARSISDTAAAADTVVRLETQARSVSDTAPASDAVTRVAADPRAVSDTAPAGDAVVRSLSLARTLADTAPATDAVARVATFARTVSDTAPASDTVSASTGGHLARDISDTAPASDTITRTGTHGRTVADTAPAGDGIVRMVVITRAVADVAAATDAVASQLTRLRVVSDVAPAVDGIVRQWTAGRVVSDTAPAIDAVVSVLTLVNPAVAPAPVVQSGWYGLLDIVRDATEQQRDEFERVPIACPDCGEPLRDGPDGEAYCQFDGSQWQEGGRRSFSSPRPPPMPTESARGPDDWFADGTDWKWPWFNN